MSLVYREHLVDLGEHGLLAMSTDFGAYLPLPANRFGYAHWYTPDPTQANGLDSQPRDVLDLCSRAVNPGMLRKRIDASAVHFERAVPSVKGGLEWTRQQADDGFREAPTGAYALSDARVLLVFGGHMPPHAFRVVNLAEQRVDFELTVNQLCEQLGIWCEPSFSVFNHHGPVVHAASEDHLCIYLGQSCVVLHVTSTGLERVPLDMPAGSFNVELTAHHWISDDREGAPVRTGLLSLPSSSLEFTTPLLRSGRWSRRACACRADRFALSHPGGQLEVIDIGTGPQDRLVRALRPLKKCGPKDALRAELSPHGRYLLVEGEHGCKLVDLDLMRMADVVVPHDYGEIDRMQFDPTVRYRSTSVVGDRGGFVLANKQLQFTSADSLAWEGLEASQPKKGRPTLWSWVQDKLGVGAVVGTSASPIDRLDTLVPSWTRPALALERRTTTGGVRSQLFGAPSLPADVTCPQHAGQSMLLLAQMVLEEAAPVGLPSDWPQTGALLFFAGLDVEGEVAFDDNFNPLATQVLWVPRLGDAPVGESLVAAVPVEFKFDPSSLPQVDAAIVDVAQLTDNELSRYTDIVEKALPDGPLDGDRIGGYPHLLQNNDLEADSFFMLHGHAPAERDLPDLAGWRLLLQLASDDACMWGTDSGIVYFMIPEAALKARDFSAVVAVCQGC